MLYLELYRQGRLLLDELAVPKEINLTEVNVGFDAMGAVARSCAVIRL